MMKTDGLIIGGSAAGLATAISAKNRLSFDKCS